MRQFPFSKTNGLIVQVPDNHEPVNYFRKIFDNEILELIVNETNYYAQEIFCSTGISGKSRITRWKPVMCEEILMFIALLLHTGSIRMNKLQDYCKNDPLYNEP